MKVFGTDYDGVMINIEPQKAAAFGALASKRGRVDEKTAKDFWFHGNVSGRRGIFNGVYEQKFGDKISDEEYKFAENEFSELLKDKFYPSARLLPGALDLIKFARTNFDRTFISSGVPMEEIKYLAGLNGIADYFDLILGTDDQFPTKKEHFNKINAEWHPANLIFVADGLTDMKIAKANGAIPIGVPTNHTPQELMDAGAVVIASLSEAIFAVRKFLN